jgi:transposase
VTPALDPTSLTAAEKDALLATLVARVDELVARVAALEAENAALRQENVALRQENAAMRAKLRLPPKTPDNSSTPPSQGHKPSGVGGAKPKGKAHAGAHRPLHPKPTRRVDVMAEECPHCRADVSDVAQIARHAYATYRVLLPAP